MDVSDMIKKLRNDVKLTQVQLSQVTGIPYSTLRSYEAGKRELGIQNFTILQKFFNVSAEYLRGEQEMIWDDPKIMNEVDSRLAKLARNVALAARNAPAESEKMIFDIFVELQHTLNNEAEHKTSALTSLLQITYYSSNNFADACYNATASDIEDRRIDKAREDTVIAYSQGLKKMQNSLLKRKDSAK